MNKKMVIIAIITLLIDQITKLIVQMIDVNLVIIKNIFSFVYVQNAGAAWGILEGKKVILIIISLVMLILIYNLSFSFKESKCTNIAFGLLFGGIIGNLLDRIFYEYVRDFISVTIFSYDFPVFNIADTVIVLGVFLILIETIKGEIKSGNSSKRKLRKN